MDYHNKPRIFVIGFMGSERKGTAEKIAKELNYRLVDLDREIEQEDGRSIQRICMTMGEHEYRNKEYESLEKLAGQNRIVVACGDGTILDEMNREILEKNCVIIADRETPVEILWERARADQESSPYAFMHQSDDKLKKEKFINLYEQRKSLYNQFG